MLAAAEYPIGEGPVAGGISPGENAIEAAVREMKEETGLDRRDPVVVHHGAYLSPGGTSKKVAIVFGLVDTAAAGGVHGNANEQEDIRTTVIPAQRGAACSTV
jgi:ADP-ribose pyrophosphatase